MAARLDNQVLNPYYYRNVTAIDTLDEFAALIGLPSDWEARYNEVLVRQDGSLLRRFNHFKDLPKSTNEATVRLNLLSLLATLSNYLGIEFDPKPKAPVIVGSLLADYEYDVRCDLATVTFVWIRNRTFWQSKSQQRRHFLYDTYGIRVLVVLRSCLPYTYSIVQPFCLYNSIGSC
jgi:hypothetical protein